MRIIKMKKKKNDDNNIPNNYNEDELQFKEEEQKDE